jgi:TRAP-type C4-dicarboxylate transport system substrate-binding protein
MSKLVFRIFVIAGLVLAFSTGLRASTLKIATLAPAGTSWMQSMQAGADRIRERTAGRVELKFYPGGVMGNDQSVHRKIRIGQLHGGAFTPSGLAHANSSIQVLSLPMLFKNLEEVDYVRERMDSIIERQMKGSGFVILGITEGGFARILSRQPMQDLESLRAGKVWVPEGDRISQVVFKALGITPISLPIADVFTGLQTGLIDTVAVNPTSAIAFQWHTSTAYMTDLPITYLIGVLAVSERSFDQLSAEDRAVLVDEMGQAFAGMEISNRADDQAAMDALGAQGITFLAPAEGEAERWRNIAGEAIDEMVSIGLVEAGIVDQVRGHLQVFRNRQ